MINLYDVFGKPNSVFGKVNSVFGKVNGAKNCFSVDGLSVKSMEIALRYLKNLHDISYHGFGLRKLDLLVLIRDGYKCRQMGLGFLLGINDLP